MDDRERYNPSKFHHETISPQNKAGLVPGLQSPYQAAATATTEETRLVVMMDKSGFQPGGTAYFTFQYSHIDIGRFGFTDAGQWFSFPFYDLQPRLLTVHGRNLFRVYLEIGSKRMPWIRVSDRDYRPPANADADEPIITRASVTNWKPEKSERESLLPALAEEFA